MYRLLVVTTTPLRELPRVLSNEEMHKMHPADLEEECAARGAEAATRRPDLQPREPMAVA
ncbi:MAG: hypothetical protein ABIQ24_02350 [Nitrospiraceae bacterium]